MQAQVTPRRGGAAFIWKWGAIAGGTLGVLQILLSLISSGTLTTLIDIVLWLVVFFVIGLFASRQTGRVGTGALTGLVTGLISGLITVLFGVIQIAANGSRVTQAINQAAQAAQRQGQHLSPTELHTLAVVSIIVGLIIVVAFELGLGAGIGALGGLVGRRQAGAPTHYVESLWSPQSSAPPPPPMPPGTNSRQE